MNISKYDRDKYGIVYTSDELVDRMVDMIPEKYYKDKCIRWLDVGSGTGQFISKVIERLLVNLSPEFETKEECYDYIIEEIVYMNEIYPPHVIELRKRFGDKANIICKDFLNFNVFEYGKFDIVIGNPPYNSGVIKTPAHKEKDKKEDGISVYVDFTKRAFDVVFDYGLVCLVIPALWLKPDKAGLYNFLTNKNIIKLNSLSTAESGKLFNNGAQVACTYFLVENSERVYDKIDVYDKMKNDYVKFELRDNNAIPTNGVSIINKLLKYVKEVGSIKYYKTNSASKKYKFELEKGDKFVYKNIKTCYMEKDEPHLVINYSNTKTIYMNNIPKLVLAHKRLGMAFLDEKGEYGVSTRDNYIIYGKDYTLNELKEVQYFLSSKFIIFIFMCFNYRMSFLERYAFNYIPMVTKLKNFPNLSQIIGDREEIIMDYFGLCDNEKKYIMKYVKDYKFFV